MSNNALGSRQISCKPGEFRAASEGENRYIEGYFAVFGSDYNIAPGMSESVDPEAFNDTIHDDIRCLTDHDMRLVLGRTSAKTFEVSVDSHGLFGRALINPDDQDAMNTYARISRGDISQASFGFDILDEVTENREDGSVHWTIKKVKLYECSVVAFPAYTETNVSARSAQLEDIRRREADAWRIRMKERLEHGFKSTDEA